MFYKGTLQIVPNPITTYKYITGTLNKGQPLERVERGKRSRVRGRVVLGLAREDLRLGEGKGDG